GPLLRGALCFPDAARVAGPDRDDRTRRAFLRPWLPQGRRVSRLLGAAAVLFAAAAARAASDCAPPTLTIATSASALRQGAVLAVTVGSDAPLSRGMLTDGRRQIPMEASEDRRTLRALVGIDFESALGRRTLS